MCLTKRLERSALGKMFGNILCTYLLEGVQTIWCSSMQEDDIVILVVKNLQIDVRIVLNLVLFLPVQVFKSSYVSISSFSNLLFVFLSLP